MTRLLLQQSIAKVANKSHLCEQKINNPRSKSACIALTVSGTKKKKKKIAARCENFVMQYARRIMERFRVEKIAEGKSNFNLHMCALAANFSERIKHTCLFNSK